MRLLTLRHRDDTATVTNCVGGTASEPNTGSDHLPRAATFPRAGTRVVRKCNRDAPRIEGSETDPLRSDPTRPNPACHYTTWNRDDDYVDDARTTSRPKGEPLGT